MTATTRALILAGGKGTRLAAAVPDRPKILAPINGRPFLDVMIDDLARRGLRRLVFLLGDRHEPIVEALRARPDVEWSIEDRPLGTGGAVRHARRFCTDDFFLLNGDTHLDFDAARLLEVHRETRSAITIAAAHVDDAGRYGSLDVGDDGAVKRFREKAPGGGPGLINGGVYVVAPRVLGLIADDTFVSLENEVFPALLSRGERVTAVPQSGAFFDIGTESSWKSFASYCAERERTT
jgi:D-glycero-alpha-D-manno-heptose 1-phosphate guanylyltransferase